jgi:glycosidase
MKNLRLFFILLPLFLITCAHKTTVEKTEKPVAAQTASATVAAPQFDWSQAVLYFAIVDRFADGDPNNDVQVDINAKGTFHGGDLKGLIEHLDEISQLGVNALWITPVVKNIDGFVAGAGFPDWAYHGYWGDDFNRLDPRFGTEEQLKTLVNECHKRGIRLLLDVVYNHAGYNSNMLKDPKTKNWFRTEELGTCGQADLTLCVAGLPDFKTELPEVDEYLYSAHLGLAKRTGLDGFRLDTVKHVDHPFWKEHRARIRNQIGQNFFLLGEVWGGDAQVLDPWFSGDELDAGFDFSFQGSVLSWLQGRGRTVAFDRYLKMREKIRAGYRVSHFLSSHDVPGALFQLKGDKDLFRLAAIVELTSVGIPMIYYGEEVARAGGDWPDNRSDMPWGDRNIMPGTHQPRDEKMRADYIKLIGFRKDHPALWRGTHTSISTEGDVLAFSQQDAQSSDFVVVAINRGSNPASVSFELPHQWTGKAIRDIWNDQSVSSTSGISLQRHGAMLLVAK